MVKSKKRIEMGEVKWAAYQQKRKREKSKRHQKKYSKKRCFAVTECRRRKKIALIVYKGGKCQICGYDKDYPSAFDFHHKDPTKKDFGIAKANKSLKRLKFEADKCDLLCVRCHAEVHHKEKMEVRQASIKELGIKHG